MARLGERRGAAMRDVRAASGEMGAASTAACYGIAMTTPIEIARGLYAALEAGAHGAALRSRFTDDATTLEHPNRIKPNGARIGLEQMIAASVAGAGLLASQRYEIRSAIEVGALAIVKATWTGVVAKPIGGLREGQVLTAHIAQFVETRDGLIASIETFDCYEPF